MSASCALMCFPGPGRGEVIADLSGRWLWPQKGIISKIPATSLIPNTNRAFSCLKWFPGIPGQLRKPEFKTSPYPMMGTSKTLNPPQPRGGRTGHAKPKGTITHVAGLSQNTQVEQAAPQNTPNPHVGMVAAGAQWHNCVLSPLARLPRHRQGGDATSQEGSHCWKHLLQVLLTWGAGGA